MCILYPSGWHGNGMRWLTRGGGGGLDKSAGESKVVVHNEKLSMSTYKSGLLHVFGRIFTAGKRLNRDSTEGVGI